MEEKGANCLAKTFLELLEDLQDEHKRTFQKLEYVMKDVERELKNKYGQFVPLSTFITQANYFDDNKFKHIRKRILDKTNDLIRNEDTP